MTRSLQWFNANSYRAYPFVEDGPRVIAGQTVPDDLLLDFQCTAYNLSQGTTWMAVITRYVSDGHELADVTFKCTGTPGISMPVVGLPASGAAAVPYTVRLSTTAYDLAVTFGAGLNTWLAALPHGSYAATEYVFSGIPNLVLEPALTIYHNRLQLQSIAGDVGYPVSGGVRVVGGYGVNIAVTPGSNTIRIVAGPGLGAGYAPGGFYPVGDDPPNLKTLLRGINGTYADGFGNIQLMGGKGVEITPDPDNHTVLIRATTENFDIAACSQSS